jgi:hypothetical protein
VVTSDPGWTYEEMKNGVDGSGKMFGGMESCCPQIKTNLLTEVKPDMMICDVMDICHTAVADDLNIPIMIHSGQPLFELANLSHYLYPTAENSFALWPCGFMILCPSLKHDLTYWKMPYKMSPMAT